MDRISSLVQPLTPLDNTNFDRHQSTLKNDGRQKRSSRRLGHHGSGRAGRGATELWNHVVSRPLTWPLLLGLDILMTAISAQCGGIGWSGATCCASGSVCTKGNDYVCGSLLAVLA